MHISKEKSKKYENSETCTVFEYPFDDKDINMAFAEIKGRYPERGFVVNEVVKEMVFVVQGGGWITVENEKYKVGPGDCVMMLPRQKFFYEGGMKLVVCCSPAWYPEQYKLINKS